MMKHHHALLQQVVADIRYWGHWGYWGDRRTIFGHHRKTKLWTFCQRPWVEGWWQGLSSNFPTQHAASNLPSILYMVGTSKKKTFSDLEVWNEQIISKNWIWHLVLGVTYTVNFWDFSVKDWTVGQWPSKKREMQSLVTLVSQCNFRLHCHSTVTTLPTWCHAFSSSQLSPSSPSSQHVS